MARTRYGTSLWLDRAPAPRLTLPRFSGSADADVVIVGGGLAGCTIASVFARAGVRVRLLEAERIGGHAGHDLGWLPAHPGASFRALQEAHGLRATRRIFEASRKAALESAAFLKRLSIKCDLARVDAVQWGRTREEDALLKRDRQARVDAGLEATWLSARALTAATRVDEGAGGVKTRGDFVCDPLRACLGLAASAIKAGAILHEKSEVTKIRAGRKQVAVRTKAGEVTAQTVILATGDPGPGCGALRRHVRISDSYIVATPPLSGPLLRAFGARASSAPALVLQDLADPPRTLRYTKDARALFQGGDQPSLPPRQQEKALLQRAGQLMYELSLSYPAISGIQPDFAWQNRRIVAHDGLLLAGPHRNFPRHLFAIGLGHAGLTGAFLAARVLLRRYLEESPDAHDELFGFSRL